MSGLREAARKAVTAINMMVERAHTNDRTSRGTWEVLNWTALDVEDASRVLAAALDAEDAEVERLRAAVAEAQGVIYSLRAENERLTSALREIAKGAVPPWVLDIARRALEGR